MTKLWRKIHIHPFTYFLILVSLLSGLFTYVLMIFGIVLIHELGHVLASIYFKRKITKVEILPFGGLLKIEAPISSDIFEDMIISASGIGMQIILGFMLYVLSYFNILDSSLYHNLREYNVVIISFNLLPLCPLDGYKMVKLLEELLIPYKKTFILSFIISLIIFSCTILIRFDLIRDNLLVFVFILASTIQELKNRKYYMMRFYLERLNYDFHFKKISHIKKLSNMYKNRLHVIRGVGEKAYLTKIFK